MANDIYFDSNATTRCLAPVIATVSNVLGANFGNPSSTHGRGYVVQELLGTARAAVEDTFNAPPASAIFTSGGTEANNLVLLGVLRDAGKRGRVPARLVTTAVEHPSVTKAAEALAAEGVEVDYVPVGQDGVVRLDALESLLSRPVTLVSVQWANSETGVLQPVADIAALCHEAKTPLHCDAAQAVGKLPIDLSVVEIDYLTFTGHKVHAPPGVGVAIDRQGRLSDPLFFGGSQERGLRPGTENVAAIDGLRVALALRCAEFDAAVSHLRLLRDRFEQLVAERIPEVVVNGGASPRVCNTANLQFPGIEGQALVAQLSRRGVYCSQTSACSSRHPRPSAALLAMGLSETQAFSSVRFSFSILNTEEEVQTVCGILSEIYGSLTRLLASQ
jgi:cysteine desulfurase